MKLRTKLILLVLSIVMPIMISVTWLLLDKTETFFHNQADQHLNDQLMLIDTLLLNKIDEVQRISNVIANRSSIQKTLQLGSSLGINRILNKIMMIYPYFNYLMIVDKDGEIYAANTLDAEGKRINGEMLLGLNVSSAPEHDRLFQKKPGLGIPGKDPFLKVLKLTETQSQWFVAPVRIGRKILGWVVVSYDWQNQMNALLAQTKQRLLEQKEPIVEIGLVDAEKRILAGDKVGNIWSSSENKWIGKKNFIIQTKKFMLIISSDKSQVLQPLIQARFFIIIGVVVTTLVLLIGLFIIITYTLIGKIRKLSVATQLISKGTFAYRVEALGKDELGDLAKSFNFMFDALHTARTGLEQKVKEQTADLQQQKEELERSNKELDDFAYVASHDLKAPLRGISQLATWVLEDFDDKEEARNHLRVMLKRVQRMEVLLDDLLEYSRIGRSETHYKEVDTRTLLEISFELATPPQAFQLELDEHLPIFETVAVPFEQVIRNLINNAVKHHHREDGKITVSVEDRMDQYFFTIEDDGPGIAEKYHEKIFQIFQTLKPRDQVEGSGMGLAMIKKIVTTYGGSISVLSHQGQGACFCLVWPKKNILSEKGLFNRKVKMENEK